MIQRRNFPRHGKIVKKKFLNFFFQTKLKIKFPDRYYIKMEFNSKEKTNLVISFVKNFILKAEYSQEFYLYTSPPPTKLVNNVNFAELQMIPSAVLHLGFQNKNFLKIPFKELVLPNIVDLIDVKFQKPVGANSDELENNVNKGKEEIEENQLSGKMETETQSKVPEDSKKKQEKKKEGAPAWFMRGKK
jgi:hypothetical protein